MTLQSKALLVQLRISQWTARKFDRKATQDVADIHKISTQAGRYNKALLPATDLLSDIHAKSSLIRSMFYKNTLPWGMEGTQLLPSANYMAFTKEFRQHKADWDLVVERFVLAYPSLIRDAQKNLGTLFNENEYPDPAFIKDKFMIDMAVMPVPDNDFRVEVTDEELTELQADVDRRVREAGEQATKELWSRLYEKVDALATKLADPSAIFRDSLIENLSEMCNLARRLNFSGDERLTNMAADIEGRLIFNPDTLRLDPDIRSLVAKRARDIAEEIKDGR